MVNVRKIKTYDITATVQWYVECFKFLITTHQSSSEIGSHKRIKT